MSDDSFRSSYPPNPREPGHQMWLVFGLPWPDPAVPVAHAAYAVRAPWPVDVPAAIAVVFAVVDVYATRHPGEPAVWFSDVTRWLDTVGLDWARLGIDWQAALDALPQGSLPGALLGIDARTHVILCDATRQGMTIVHPDARRESVTEAERARLHERMRDLLETTVVETPQLSEPGRGGR